MSGGRRYCPADTGRKPILFRLCSMAAQLLPVPGCIVGGGAYGTGMPACVYSGGEEICPDVKMSAVRVIWITCG